MFVGNTNTMKNFFGLTLFIVLLFAACSPNRPNENFNPELAKEKVISELYAQEKSWNEGNIEAFMNGYWNDDSLMFVSGDRISYGWQKVTDNYKRKYSSKELMGHLDFKIDKVDVLSSDAIVVIGQWDLKNEASEFGGKFSLLWRKINGEWKIVIDHTS